MTPQKKNNFREFWSSLNKIIKSLGEEKLGFINEEEKKIAKKLRAHLTDE